MSQLLLISRNEKRPDSNLSPNERRKLALVGMIQMVPLLAGGMVAMSTDSTEYAASAALIAIGLAGLIGQCLHRYIPPTRIEVRLPHWR